MALEFEMLNFIPVVSYSAVKQLSVCLSSPEQILPKEQNHLQITGLLILAPAIQDTSPTLAVSWHSLH